MKCAYCHAALNPANVWVVCWFSPDTHVLNLHGFCVGQIIGKKAFDQLGRVMINEGWTQLELPIQL
jgi:hypothetical protein